MACAPWCLAVGARLNSAMALTSREYWDRTYVRRAAVRRPMFDPRWSYFANELLGFVSPYLPKATPQRVVRLLEVGCGNSRLLPYFAHVLGYAVAGIDYSPNACLTALANVRTVGYRAAIWCADVHHPGARVHSRYDIVISCGVVEHFHNVDDIVGQIATFVAPGGILITLVPNMCGVMGRVQRLLGRSIYELHVPLNLDALIKAHRVHDLAILEASYLGFLALGMLNLGPWSLKDKIGRVLAGLDVLHMYARRALGLRWRSRAWCSYVGVVARRAGSAE